MPDLWLVAVSAAAAAAAAVLGVIPVIVSGEVSPRLGWASALAAGLMLGAGYVLLQQGITLSPVGGIAASVDRKSTRLNPVTRGSRMPSSA